MKVGAHWIVREMLLPEAWGQFGDATGRMLTDSLQDIDQVGVGIDAVESAGDDQTLDYAERAARRSSNRPR